MQFLRGKKIEVLPALNHGEERPSFGRGKVDVLGSANCFGGPRLPMVPLWSTLGRVPWFLGPRTKALPLGPL